MKFAAVDVGSNAIRLLLARVIDDGQEPFVKKESLIRIPLRLGDDAFVRKQISVEKAAALVNSMKGFSYLMRAYRPITYRACATSAMRRLDGELIRQGQYVLPGVRRFVSTVHDGRDLEDTLRGLDAACKAFHRAS